MVQISGEDSKPFWLYAQEERQKSPLPPLRSQNEGLRDIGHSMGIGNLILGVNSVTVSHLIHYDSLLQNAVEVCYKMCQAFYHKMRQFYCKIRLVTIPLQNATVITKCDVY